jgi:molybdenum cofactor cytidylyltransferase
VTPATVQALIGQRCRHDAGRLSLRRRARTSSAFGQRLFAELGELHGDKAVWKLMDRLADQVVEVGAGPDPPDVDTREDYEAILAEAGTSA